MALVSMTGFSRTEGSLDGFSWVYEIKSVNGKNLDIRTRLPHGMEALEMALKKLATNYFRRGNLQLNLQVTREQGGSNLVVNEPVLEQVLQIAQGLQKRLGSPALKVEDLLALRGVLEMAEAEEDDETRQARQTALLKNAKQAFAALAAMRGQEGARIEQVIRGQIAKIHDLTVQARDCPDRTPQAIKARFAELVSKLLETSDQLDPDRLHAEAVLIATRADIQEELDRLFAHVEAANQLLDSKDAIGRKLDFMAQEFNREANTLCSKASSTELSHIGLEMKTTIDQLREQVQNIE
jgi:uncharacterized protein (TIGR00255 family)